MPALDFLVQDIWDVVSVGQANVCTGCNILRIVHADSYKCVSFYFKESTQTVQALQYSTVDGPLTASKDLEIQSLKEEIEKLRKQVTGKSQLCNILEQRYMNFYICVS